MKINIKKIHFERKRLCWTMSRLAKEIKMTRQGLSVLLKRRTAPLGTLDKIGKALVIDAKDLLT